MENGFCNSDQKSMLMVGFLTCNDSDILRSKTGPYRRIGYQTNILPTPVTVAFRLLETVSESSRSSSQRQTDTVCPVQRVQSEDGNGL